MATSVTFSTPPDSGIYHLLLHLEKPVRLHVGALGLCSFPAGYYTYTGRAMRGLSARINRHIGKKKIKRWHIDYFRPRAKLVEIRIIPTNIPEEEERLVIILWNLAKEEMRDNAIPIPGFGSSDSRMPAHLIFWGTSKPLVSCEAWGYSISHRPLRTYASRPLSMNNEKRMSLK